MQIFPSVPKLELVIFYTLGNSNVWIGLGSHPAEVGKGFVLMANGGSRFKMDREFMVTDGVNAITEDGSQQPVYFQAFT